MTDAIETLLAAANGKRKKLLLTRADIDQAIADALADPHGIAVRHGGAEILGKSTLCLAVRPVRRAGVVVGIRTCYADRPTPGRVWKEVGPWQQDFAKNVARAQAWAAAKATDRVFVTGGKPAKPRAAANAGAKLLAEILAHPDDDQARLVYADHLTETGDPRGELITAQIALARTRRPVEKRALTRRVNELLKKHARAWSKEAMQDGKDVELRRGFVARVTMTGTVWGKKGARLFDHDPIEELWVARPNAAGLRAIAGAAHTARLRTITFRDPFWMQSAKDVAALREFLASPHVGEVRALAITVDHDRFLAAMPETRGLFTGLSLPKAETVRFVMRPAIDRATLKRVFPRAKLA